MWKDSSLALVFHGLEQEGERRGVVNKIGCMEDVAKDVKVRLEQTEGDDWMLFQVKEPHDDD